MSPRPRQRAFTLAEVAVTIAVVGLALVWMLQALNAAKVTAAQTRNKKLARELALLTLGEIESGLYAEEVSEEYIEGSYAEVGYPDFFFEAVFGDDNFRPSSEDPSFDNWVEERLMREDEDEDEEAEQPYEKVQVRVTFPPIQEMKNEYTLERWLPWNQVHPPEEDEATGIGGGSGPGQ